MATTSSRFIAGSILLCATITVAQESESKRKATAERPDRTPEKKDLGHFPAPLQHISGNLKDLEKTGYLSVVGVENRAIDSDGHRGWVWTIKTVKPITGGHLRAMLNKYRLVRFFVQQKTTTKEIYTGMLHYSNRIDTAAVNGQVFLKDEVFELRLRLDASARRRLAAAKINSVVFAAWRR